LLKWVRAGPLAEDRLDHQAMESDTVDDAASSEPESMSVEEDLACLADALGEDSPGGGAMAATVARLGEVSPEEEGSRGCRPGARERACWVCAAEHPDGVCSLAKRLFPGPEPELKSAGALRPAGRLATDALRLPAKAVQCKDVPGDGHCLFHAAGKEILGKFPVSPLLPPSPKDGQS